MLHGVWMPIFQMYSDKSEPSWDDFVIRFGKYIPDTIGLHLPILTVDMFRETLNRMKSNSACGPDGWRAGELKNLPDEILARVVELLEIVEETGIWPNALAHGLVTLVTKGEGSRPEDLRPISVMSVVYRAWASTRLRDVISWQENWIHECQHGFRTGHGPEDVWWKLAVQVERALLEGSDLAGVSLDYSKCFDRIPITIVLRLAERIGMDARLLKAIKGMFDQLQRRFRVNGAVGKPFTSTNGILQGCPLSVIFLNLLVCVWIRAVKEEVPDAELHAFADDTGATATGSTAPHILQRVLNMTGAFAKLTGQQLNPGKSKCWSTSDSIRREIKELTLDEVALKHVTSMRCLGAFICFSHGAFVNPLGNAACEEATNIARRIRWAPLSMKQRALLVGSLVNPKALHSHPSGGIAKTRIQSLRSACVAAVWGETRKLKCPEIVMTLFVKGHRSDPRQYAAYSCIRLFRIMLKKYPCLVHDVVAILQLYEQGPGQVTGPIRLLSDTFSSLGWSLVPSLTIQRPGMPALAAMSGPDSWWFHHIRDKLRVCEWTRAASRRHDMEGLDSREGVDREATCGSSNSFKDPLKQGMLRSILSGSLRLGHRLFKAKLWDSPICPFCGTAEETLRHCFWECSVWDTLRLDPELPTREELSQLPTCTTDCGIFLSTPDEFALQHDIQPCAHVPHTCFSFARADLETHVGGAVVAWTDGACPKNQFRQLRRAGCGVFFGTSHPGNLSFKLPGPEQTNQRAELAACIACIESNVRPLEIRTDSKYVIDGAGNPGRRGDNGDLWKIFHSLIQAREPGHVRFVKVKGHAKKIHVASGEVLAIDKWGNDAADTLAVRGASMHAIPAKLGAAKAKRQAQAKAVHSMMLRILKARAKAETVLGLAAVDNLEEEHEDPWNFDEPMYVPHPRSGEG